MLAAVARAGDRGVTREKLLGMLWPDSDEENGRASLSQALSMLRRELGDGDVFTGVQALRLNQAAATCDVLEFEAAMAAGDHERAVALYDGPFLEAFRVPGAEGLDRWIEEERSHLATRFAEALERLGRQAMERGKAVKAVDWWRRRAALDPLNARVTLELMRALAAAGERHAAIRQARIYEALVDQELALGPDSEVVKFAAALRNAPPDTVPAAPEPVATPTLATVPPAFASVPTPLVETTAGSAPPAPSPTAPLPTPAPPRLDRLTLEPARRHRLAAVVGALLIVAVLGLLFIVKPAPPAVPSTPVLAVGRIVDYREGSADQSGPVTDMLATNLARVSGLQVISSLRVLELADRAGTGSDPATRLARAAREAGASEVLEGGLHMRAEGMLLLELRRIDLTSGAVRLAYQVEGADLFELVSKSTGEIAASLGHTGGSLDPAEAGSRSLVALRFYQEGMQRFVKGHFREARGLFDAAIKEDSNFAMAAYYRLVSGGPIELLPDPGEIERLERLGRRTTDREGLFIRTFLAIMSQSPSLLAVAETLAVRYPAELDGHYLVGYARLVRGEFAQALPHLHRVVELDSTALTPGMVRCQACDAVDALVYAYQALDSFPRAERMARAWLARDSTSVRAWGTLGSLLLTLDRLPEATEAWRRRTEQPYNTYDALFGAVGQIRAGDFTEADRQARAVMASLREHEGTQARWVLAMSLRYQGRWTESLSLMRERLASLTREQRAEDHEYLPALLSGLVLMDADKPTEAARLLDSIARHPHPSVTGGRLARRQAYQYVLLAETGLAMGDTILVRRAADSGRAWAGRAAGPREERMADHGQALVLLARHDTAAAMEHFRRAIYSTTLGFTRSSYWLGRLLNARGQSAEAVRLLRPALRGPLDNTNLYVTQTEIREELAQAYTRLGQRDSARVQWEWVARALANADPAARDRLARARAALQ